MYATDELWFEEHDMQGTPWSNPDSYHKWAPVSYAGELGKFKTPTLVICGERDYRVPYTIAQRLGAGIDGGARARFGSVRRERYGAGKKRRSPAPLRARATHGSVREQRRGRRADKRMNKIPNRVDIRNLVREKFDEIQNYRYPYDPGMREGPQRRGQMDDSNPLEKPERRHRCVEIQPGGKSGAERKA